MLFCLLRIVQVKPKCYFTGDGSWRRGDNYDHEAKAAYTFLNTVTLMRSTKTEFEDFCLEMRKSQQKTGVCEGCSDVRKSLKHSSTLSLDIKYYNDLF